MPTLFDPVKIGALELPNRLVMAPSTRMRAFEERAPGPLKFGALRSARRRWPDFDRGHISHAARGRLSKHAGPLVRIADPSAGPRSCLAVHHAGGRIVSQLWHVGRISDPVYLGGELPVAPSAIAAGGHVSVLRPQKSFEVPRPLAIDEIPGIVDDFRKAARNAKPAGFDGVELHAANGYLFDQFLHDGSNTRTDRYGDRSPIAPASCWRRSTRCLRYGRPIASVFI